MPSPNERSDDSAVKTAIPLKTLTEEHTGALSPEDSVKTAGDRMREQHSSAWPVAEDQKLVGTVDEANPDWKMGGHGHDPEAWKVGSIMKRELIFCYEDEDCAHAVQVMEERGLSYLPVVDRQMRIVGIFSHEEVKRRAQSG